MTIDEDDLAKAALLWTGHGTRSWPHRDDEALVREFGAAYGLDLLATLKALDVDFYSSDAHRAGPGLSGMVERATYEFRLRHPSAPTMLVDALAWCYSYDWK